MDEEKAGAYVGDTEHGKLRGAKRDFSSKDVEQAVESAGACGHVTFRTGKYGTLQAVYAGTNGLIAVLETEGRNAGKLITAWWSQL